MPALAAHPRLSYAEYLAFEEQSELRHEFCEGVVLAMAGGTGAHARLKTNLTGLVHTALKGRPCQPRDADQRVRVVETDLSTYPDLSVVCGPRVPAADDPHALTNPTVIFEVLSKGTAAYDAGEKFDHYARLPSLQQYVLVDSERVHVYVYTRGEGGTWVRMGHAEGEQVPLRSIDIVLSMEEIYEGWAEERVIDAGG